MRHYLYVHACMHAYACYKHQYHKSKDIVTNLATPVQSCKHCSNRFGFKLTDTKELVWVRMLGLVV